MLKGRTIKNASQGASLFGYACKMESLCSTWKPLPLLPIGMLAARCFFYRQQFLYGCLKADFFLSSPSVSTDSESYSLLGGMKRLVACAILTDFAPQQAQNKEKGERDCKRVKTERRRHDQQRQAGKYESRSEKA